MFAVAEFLVTPCSYMCWLVQHLHVFYVYFVIALLLSLTQCVFILSNSFCFHCCSAFDLIVVVLTFHSLHSSHQTDHWLLSVNLTAMAISTVAGCTMGIWEHSFNGCFISRLTYLFNSVHFSRLLGGEELQKVLRETRVIVDQLIPFTNYSFYVRSYNARRKSRPSAVITQLTAEDGQLQVIHSSLFS